MSEPAYVLGFCFNAKGDRVHLLKKLRPDWQRGKLNGVGGTIEMAECPDAAMIREAREEAALDVTWQYVGYMSRDFKEPRFLCHVYRAFATESQFSAARQCEDQELVTCNPRALPPAVLPNLRWLIPLCLDGQSPQYELVATITVPLKESDRA